MFRTGHHARSSPAGAVVQLPVDEMALNYAFFKNFSSSKKSNMRKCTPLAIKLQVNVVVVDHQSRFCVFISFLRPIAFLFSWFDFFSLQFSFHQKNDFFDFFLSHYGRQCFSSFFLVNVWRENGGRVKNSVT